MAASVPANYKDISNFWHIIGITYFLVEKKG